MADYADLTVTDDDYAEEERERFQKFLKERKEDKELGARIYGDERALREKQGYDDDYMGAAEEEKTHAFEEAERITDLLKKQMPETERLRQEELYSNGETMEHMD